MTVAYRKSAKSTIAISRNETDWQDIQEKKYMPGDNHPGYRWHDKIAI